MLPRLAVNSWTPSILLPQPPNSWDRECVSLCLAHSHSELCLSLPTSFPCPQVAILQRKWAPRGHPKVSKGRGIPALKGPLRNHDLLPGFQRWGGRVVDEGGGSNQKSMSRYVKELSLPGVWLQPRPRSQSVCTRAGWVQIKCKQAQGVMGKIF